MQRIVPNIWCNGTAAEAGAFYASVFPEATWAVTARYPETDLPDFQRDYAGKELVVDVAIGDYQIRLINAGNEFRPTPAISFMVTVDPRRFGGDATDDSAARATIDRMWASLTDGGAVLMPLDAYPFSPHFGWVADKFGVSWQLMLPGLTGRETPFVAPHFLFTGAEPRAKEAVGFYTALFDDAAAGTLVPYPEGAGQQGVMFGDLTLAGQRFTVADGGAMHDFTFTPGLSLQVDCADQAEIDRLWAALSAVPEAEQCGWLVDRFGVSWQIVPAQMGELLQRPGAYQHMLGMKKLVIADF
jgi:predicted 3-demethylubiquinone-9 3-methyltransferase (glyoxalase superfamily)